MGKYSVGALETISDGKIFEGTLVTQKETLGNAGWHDDMRDQGHLRSEKFLLLLLEAVNTHDIPTTAHAYISFA